MSDPTVTNGMQSEDRRTHVERLNPAFKGPAMTDAQFAELKALLIKLLTPGYELSTFYLAQVHQPNPAPVAEPAAADVATETHG